MAIGKVYGIEKEKIFYSVTFNLTPEDATLVVKDLKGSIIEAKERNKYELEVGLYTYTASAEGYITKKNENFSVDGETSINVVLQKELEIVSFATATDEQLEKMLNAHYNRRNRFVRNMESWRYKINTYK